MDKFICIGKNYLDHAKELGDDIPKQAILFFKPASCGLFCQGHEETLKIRLPRERGVVHFECELMFKVAQWQVDAQPHSLFNGVTVGLDLTLREEQFRLKKFGHPWELAKSFHQSAVVGPVLPLIDYQSALQQTFELKINGQSRQKAKGLEMRFDPADVILEAGTQFPVCPGDMVYTGSPEGTGEIQIGDVGEVYFNDSLLFSFSCV